MAASNKASKNTVVAAATLDEQITVKRVELLETKRSHAAGELVNPRALGRIRKEIARLKTQQNATVSEIKEISNDQSSKGATV